MCSFPLLFTASVSYPRSGYIIHEVSHSATPSLYKEHSATRIGRNFAGEKLTLSDFSLF